MKRVNLSGRVHNPPMLIGPDFHSQHRFRMSVEFTPVDIEPVLILSEGAHKVRNGFFQTINVHNLIDRSTRSSHIARRWNLPAWNNVSEDHFWIRIAIRSGIHTSSAQCSTIAYRWSGNN